MPKLVCVKCEVELEPVTTGTTVVETASFGIYKVWHADTWQCPHCGTEIVAGFAKEPIRDDHYAPDFSAWAEQFIASSRRVVYDREVSDG